MTTQTPKRRHRLNQEPSLKSVAFQVFFMILCIAASVEMIVFVFTGSP